jgi:hypothetical protein
VSTHEVVIRAQRRDNLRVACSCGSFVGETDEITLDRLTAAVHEHIEAAEAEVINRDSINDVRLGRDVAGEGYRTESAITSEDQLLDLESFMADECVGCTGLVHHDQCPMWALPL